MSVAPALRPPPTPEQRRAADPASSVWVTASAGTGKTRVLADRVLRLLLGGTAPGQILCLTFTKAAAAEMVARVQTDLGQFATRPEADLGAALRRLLGRSPTGLELGRARRLLAEVLDLPAGLPIMTIHGFCQSLLRRFPLEAGVAPHFEVIEPRDAADLLREAQEEILISRQPAIQKALARLAVLLGEVPLAEGLTALRENRLRLTDVLDREIDATIAKVYRVLGLDPGATVDAVRAASCADPEIDDVGLQLACRALGTGSENERDRAERILAWLSADPGARCERYLDYEHVLFTKKREARQKDVIAKRNADAHPDAADALETEQRRLARWVEREKAAAVAERTAALLQVGAAVLNAYRGRKTRLSVLDYDDLIDYSRRLLQQGGIASWVQYKLDQQIDHLLVDEGQDTSPEQWAIIEALSAEFFSGEGARAAGRTLFVVGDEKQSIMSFQGADLGTYQQLRRRLGDRARAVGQDWAEEPLSLSFRSTAPILEVVDAVFASAEARAGVVAGEAWPHHECSRGNEPGLVEVWPLIETEPPAKPGDWELPDRRAPVDQAEQRLAQLIAGRIRQWRRDETLLPATGRPITAGDVMVLLPRRGVLQDLLVRELKRLQVPVAGADRLALSDEIAVMDLMALGDAILLPEDDLTLAALLKSPLFGLSDDDLFELAYDRGSATLFQRLLEKRSDRPIFGEASDRFTDLLAQADFAPPFELYARVLGEGGGRKRLVARLGHAAIEPIEAFLAQALAYERGHPPSLQGFLHWLRADATELTRDPDQPRDEVRVLTVHGAKGLEAPIVFLADTTFVPDLKDRLLWLEPGGLPVWKVGATSRDAASERAYQGVRGRQLEEQRRLLYVALTRARDWLIVTGCKHQKPIEGTWYDLITEGLERLGAEQADLGQALGQGWRFGSSAGSVQLALPLDRSKKIEPAPPGWLDQPAPAEAVRGRPLSPSHLSEDSPPAASPLFLARPERRRRGRVIHRLLQLLPGRDPGERDPAMARYLTQPGLGLTPDQQADIVGEVYRILDAPELAGLFGPGSRAEVPLAGTVGDQVIVGQVDRLAVTAQEVRVIDYKTDRRPPATPEEVPLAYLRQMAAYRALLRQIYPEHEVVAALLWTEGPQLMVLGDQALDRHAPGA